MRLVLSLSLLALLAACGVDGAPQPPAERTTGVTISGEASLGVSGRL